MLIKLNREQAALIPRDQANIRVMRRHNCTHTAQTQTTSLPASVTHKGLKYNIADLVWNPGPIVTHTDNNRLPLCMRSDLNPGILTVRLQRLCGIHEQILKE